MQSSEREDWLSETRKSTAGKSKVFDGMEFKNVIGKDEESDPDSRRRRNIQVKQL